MCKHKSIIIVVPFIFTKMDAVLLINAHTRQCDMTKRWTLRAMKTSSWPLHYFEIKLNGYVYRMCRLPQTSLTATLAIKGYTKRQHLLMKIIKGSWSLELILVRNPALVMNPAETWVWKRVWFVTCIYQNQIKIILLSLFCISGNL